MGIQGLDKAELDRIREELAERLKGHELSLGDLRQDNGERSGEGTGAQRDLPEGPALASEKETRSEEKKIRARRANHDGSLYVAA